MANRGPHDTLPPMVEPARESGGIDGPARRPSEGTGDRRWWAGDARGIEAPTLAGEQRPMRPAATVAPYLALDRRFPRHPNAQTFLEAPGVSLTQYRLSEKRPGPGSTPVGAARLPISARLDQEPRSSRSGGWVVGVPPNVGRPPLYLTS